MKNEIQPLLLEINSVATLLCLSESTIRHWTYKTRKAPDGFPKPVNLGRSLRYRIADLIKFVNEIPNSGTPENHLDQKKEFIESEIFLVKKRGRPLKKNHSF